MMDVPIRPRLSTEQLVSNARGVAFAAFGPLDMIEKMLGCSHADADQFQRQAQSDFIELQRLVKQAYGAD